MTPSEIAREARITYRKQMQDYCGTYRQDPPDLDALILTAAAKMVRESGAVEAIVAMSEAGYGDDPEPLIANMEAALAKLRALTDAAEGKPQA